jgi:hypothetical protein
MIAMQRNAFVLGIMLLISILGLFGCSSAEEQSMIEDGNISSTTQKAEEPEFVIEADLINPNDLIYLGAFRLPGSGERPYTFAYGGEAMTYNPTGNTGISAKYLPGSLFVMGHNRMPYGELPDGNQIAEITIPTPVIAKSIDELSQADFIQEFHVIDDGTFAVYEEIPRVGMEYLETSSTGPLIHLSWGQHFHDQPDTEVASHAWFSPNLSVPDLQGPWYIGNQSLYSVNDYLFTIPAEWAEEYVGGRPLATGRFRDGGWSGMGPALFAYSPWNTETISPEAPNSRLEEVVLLLYESSANNSNIERCLNGYQHGDEWSGGAWITTNDGSAAVIFAGTKSTGKKYWYGFTSPKGPQHVCIESEYLGQFTLCRMADGTPCPDESSARCTDHYSNRGWWSTSFNARIILYNPADLARVALGQIEPWEPQPYAYLDVDDYLFHNPTGVEAETLGSGVQRRYRLGDIAYDRENGFLYLLELFADGAKPVVHVWQIQ